MQAGADEIGHAQRPLHRRQFLKSTGALMAASALGGTKTLAGAESPTNAGVETVRPASSSGRDDLKIRRTPDGGHFPNRPYYPLYLANGVDAMLINLLGSGDAWWRSCDYRATLPLQYAAGWFKSDRRATHRGGRLVPFFEFASCPLLNGDLGVPRNCSQYFDPRRAMLTTLYEQKDNETDEWMRVRVSTFLLKDHVLVEHYEFVETPAAGVALRFFMNPPSPPANNLYRSPLVMDEVSLEVLPEESLMRYTFAFDDVRGGALSWVDGPSELGHAEKIANEPQFISGVLTSVAMHAGQSLTRYLAAIDEQDDRDFRTALPRTIERCREIGYDGLRRAHEQQWAGHFNTCAVRIPDERMAFIYDVSRYLTAANHHPSGFHPVGLFPHLWQGVMFWDAGFAAAAMIGCGNLAEAREILSHLRTYLPESRKAAREFDSNARGARLPWTVSTKAGISRVREMYNSVWFAHWIHACYECTGDTTFLAEHFDLMEEFTVFLVDAFVEKHGGYLRIKQTEGIDESQTHPKVNDTMTCAILLRALIDYRDALAVLNRPSIIDRLDEVIQGLRAGLDSNIDAHGVMQSFHGGRIPHWGSLIFDLFPDHPALLPTLEKMMENYDPEMDAYNFRGVNRFAEKAFPWGDCWAARNLARKGDPRALSVLEKSMRWVNHFGGFPERIDYHGGAFKHWFQTAHNAFVWAVNGMLANVTGNRLQVFGPVAGQWRDAAFDRIHAGRGLVVSAELSGGRLVALEIDNRSGREQLIECVFGGGTHRQNLVLRPGRNVVGGLPQPMPAPGRRPATKNDPSS